MQNGHEAQYRVDKWKLRAWAVRANKGRFGSNGIVRDEQPWRRIEARANAIRGNVYPHPTDEPDRQAAELAHKIAMNGHPAQIESIALAFLVEWLLHPGVEILDERALRFLIVRACGRLKAHRTRAFGTSFQTIGTAWRGDGKTLGGGRQVERKGHARPRAVERLGKWLVEAYAPSAGRIVERLRQKGIGQ